MALGVLMQMDVLGRKETAMPKYDGVFVPHSHCTVASGDCFTEGRCLAQCSAHRKKDHESRIRELERAVVRLAEQINDMRPNT